MVLGLLRLHHHVIYIDRDGVADEVFEDIIHESLIGGPYVFKAKGHDFVAVVLPFHHERCFVLIRGSFVSNCTLSTDLEI